MARRRTFWITVSSLPAVVGAVVVFAWPRPTRPEVPALEPPGDELAATDWPHLRGPNYDAVSAETGLADAWPPDGPPVLWSRDLGQGYSGFVVVGRRAFTQAQTLAGQVVLCLDRDTGQTL